MVEVKTTNTDLSKLMRETDDYVCQTDTITLGNFYVSLFNKTSEKEVEIELGLTSEHSSDEISPESAYQLGKHLIDFAENAMRLRHYYENENENENKE